MRTARYMPFGAAAAVAALLLGMPTGGSQVDAQSTPTTIGSNLGSSGADYSFCGSSTCTLLQTALPGATLTSPSDGTITQWRIRDSAGTFRLRIMRPTTGGFLVVASSNPVTLSYSDTVSTFPVSMPVQAGDYIALDLAVGSKVGIASTSGATFESVFPSPADGSIVNPGAPAPSQELLFDADVQPTETTTTTTTITTTTTTPTTTTPTTTTTTPPTSSIGGIRVKRAAVSLVAKCAGTAHQTCRDIATLTEVEGLRTDGVASTATSRTVIIGKRTFSISGGSQRRVSITLNKLGRTLLGLFKSLHAKLAVATNGSVIKRATVTLS